MKELTDKQLSVYEAIKEYIEKNRYSPSIRDLCKMTRLNSSATIHHHLTKLKEKGFISWNKRHYRSIVILKDL